MKTPDANAQTVKLLWYNTFLLHGFSIGPMHQLAAKPQLTNRARELGTRLQKLIDAAAIDSNNEPKLIFALCEVFSPKTFTLIHEQLDINTTRFATGPQSGPHALLTTPDATDLSQHFPRWLLNVVKASRGALPIASGL